jgi:MFS family permease
MNDSPHRTEPLLTHTRYLVLVWLCSAAAIAYVHRNCLGVAAGTISADLGLSLKDMGLVLASFFFGYAVFQIPAGWLADRWGTRRLLTLLSFVWSLATAALALAEDFMAMVILRFIGGSAQAGIFSCATKSISKWFPNTERGMSSGFLGSFMSVGGAVGAAATGLLLRTLSWQWILVLYAVPGLVWSAWFYFWFRDRPEDHPSVRRGSVGELPVTLPTREAESTAKIGEPHGPTPWMAVVASPTMWWIGGQQFFRAAGYIFYASWFTKFLQETRGVTIDQAGVLTSLPLWGVVIGSPLGGILSDWILSRTGRRRIARQGVAVVSMFGCAVLIVLAYLVENVWLAVLVISAGSFWSALGGPCAYAVTIDVGGEHVGTVFSAMNMCGNIGAAVFPLVVPPLVAAAGSWDIVLFLFAGTYVAAGVCWMLVDPNGSIFDQKH